MKKLNRYFDLLVSFVAALNLFCSFIIKLIAYQVGQNINENVYIVSIPPSKQPLGKNLKNICRIRYQVMTKNISGLL